jgi:hypothetical protein
MSSRIPASLLRIAYRLVTLVRPDSGHSYPAQPAVTVFQGGQTGAGARAQASAIPQRIWSYWNTEVPDPVVRQCIANWRTQCPDFEVHVVNSANLATYVPPADLPPGFAQLHPTKQSDWLRLYLVRHHGGYWLDATTLLTQPLDWLEKLRQAQDTEFVGFFLQGYTQDAGYPIVESWAFGAAPHSPFVSAWQEEFHRALIVQGPTPYLQALRHQPDGAAMLQGIPDPQYLLIHVTAQQVLRRHNAYRLALLKAEDTAFFYQKAVRWKWYLLYPRLCLVRAEADAAPLVKLRGGERRHFVEMFAQHGRPLQGSIWQRACGDA